MFDAVATPGRRRAGPATVASVAVHATVVAFAVLMSLTRAPPTSVEAREVRVMPPRSPTPTRGREGGAQPSQKPERRLERAAPPRVRFVEKAIPAAKPAEPPAVERQDETSLPGPPTSEATPTGSPDGAGTGETYAPIPTGARVQYDDARMTPPRRISGPDPEYTPEALQNEIEGLMVVSCIVTVEGIVHGCRVVQGLPYMDRAVVEALEQRRYAPARLSDGRPIDVEYTFRVRLQLPR